MSKPLLPEQMPFDERIREKLPILNTREHFVIARELLWDHGVKELMVYLVESGVVDPENGLLTTGFNPFNVFARIGKKKIVQPGMKAENGCLHKRDVDKYVVASNRPENDKHWNSAHPDWVGKASMGELHRFMTKTDLSWEWFNILTFGIEGGATLVEAIAELKSMKDAAIHYTTTAREMDVLPWGENVGFFLHVYGHASVPSIHLHMVDLDKTGPTYAAMEYKNLSIDDAIAVLEKELGASPEPERVLG